ncbi:hypothetical protein ANHYDRO_00357 [Anaerococcus hydrogenalis DSM 7454]|uniref:UvrABC system protein A n=1 Tax=Anaerococcus hydrogenalis DSM 7454 TaxID=561177 RepID=B6W739_9FIRM|nr:hypothetical protein [Anaerococcus hydrogenalis]EEB36756.1 hypothetical protein ANHYDRO_00357 [Anaerococcus hydrogenalis DSM 7454]
MKGIDVKFPLSTFTAVTGVSGSGKSSLVNEILYKSVTKKLNKSKTHPGKHDSIEGVEQIDKIISIDQSPIGRTPRSNPATYTKLFDNIRDVFAMTTEAKMKGFDKGRFSFNVKGGRCEACKGDGTIKVDMMFLPDVYVPCEVCHGQRYNRETLEVKYKGKNISEVLDMTVEEALKFFENHPSIVRKLQTLYDVGLGYIKNRSTINRTFRRRSPKSKTCKRACKKIHRPNPIHFGRTNNRPSHGRRPQTNRSFKQTSRPKQHSCSNRTQP